MAEKGRYYGLLQLQQFLVWLVIAAFAVAIAAEISSRAVGEAFYNIALLILILSAPVRLLWIGEHFRKNGNHLYQILTYLVIAVIVLAMIWKFTR